MPPKMIFVSAKSLEALKRKGDTPLSPLDIQMLLPLREGIPLFQPIKLFSSPLVFKVSDLLQAFWMNASLN